MFMAKRAINLRLDNDLIQAVDDLAEAMGTDRTELIARGLRRELLFDGGREFIYVLIDGDRCVRYVGRARDPYKRLREHIAAARAGGSSAKERWLADMLSTGALPQLAVIDDAPKNEIRDLESVWIDHFKVAGKLTNGVRGPIAGVLRYPKRTGMKNFGMLDEALMDRVDAEAKRLGQTRRLVTERALERELSAEPQRQREAIQSALQDLERGQMRYAIATLEAALGGELPEYAREQRVYADSLPPFATLDRADAFRQATAKTARAGKR